MRDATGAFVASALVLPFDGPFAWISMVLVTGAHRRRGIATTLMAHCMARLDALGLTPVLDATDAGRQVYAPLGFQPVHGLRRLRAAGIGSTVTRGEGGLRPIAESDWGAVAELDRRAFGADRAALLRHLRARQPSRALVAVRADRVVGFVLARDGSHALQVGPVVAEDADTAGRAHVGGAGGRRPRLPRRRRRARCLLRLAGGGRLRGTARIHADDPEPASTVRRSRTPLRRGRSGAWLTRTDSPTRNRTAAPPDCDGAAVKHRRETCCRVAAIGRGRCNTRYCPCYGILIPVSRNSLV